MLENFVTDIRVKTIRSNLLFINILHFLFGSIVIELRLNCLASVVVNLLEWMRLSIFSCVVKPEITVYRHTWSLVANIICIESFPR